MTDQRERRLSQYLAPKYWPVWLLFGALRAASALPFRTQMWLGAVLGRLSMRLLPKRQRVAHRNLRLCFATMDDNERRTLVRAHFENLGISIFEMAMAYYRPARLLDRITVHGAEHLDQQPDKQIILLTAHFGALEVGGTALKARGLVFDAVYRKDRNPLVSELIRRGRENAGRQTIEKSNIKEMVRSLRSGVPVWYAPDQSYRRKQSALLDFFGEPAMTNTATSALARLGKSAVIGFFPHRRADRSGYDIVVHPPLARFPSDDPLADTLRITEIFEAEIRRSPAQYFWVHRKFKGRPDTLDDAYADLASEALE
ncbi:MAG: lipid A biosynthesis acyltransferase [Pseudomonadota bacterium]